MSKVMFEINDKKYTLVITKDEKKSSVFYFYQYSSPTAKDPQLQKVYFLNGSFTKEKTNSKLVSVNGEWFMRSTTPENKNRYEKILQKVTTATKIVDIVNETDGFQGEGNKVTADVTQFFADGVYQGEVKAANQNVKGTFFYSNGDKYEGGWKDRNMDGPGTYFCSNGQKYNGYWEDNKKEGEGITPFSNGENEAIDFTTVDFTAEEYQLMLSDVMPIFQLSTESRQLYLLLEHALSTNLQALLLTVNNPQQLLTEDYEDVLYRVYTKFTEQWQIDLKEDHLGSYLTTRLYLKLQQNIRQQLDTFMQAKKIHANYAWISQLNINTSNHAYDSLINLILPSYFLQPAYKENLSTVRVMLLTDSGLTDEDRLQRIIGLPIAEILQQYLHCQTDINKILQHDFQAVFNQVFDQLINYFKQEIGLAAANKLASFLVTDFSRSLGKMLNEYFQRHYQGYSSVSEAIKEEHELSSLLNNYYKSGDAVGDLQQLGTWIAKIPAIGLMGGAKGDGTDDGKTVDFLGQKKERANDHNSDSYENNNNKKQHTESLVPLLNNQFIKVWTAQPTVGDGNCFFHALFGRGIHDGFEYIYRSENAIEQRKILMDYMSNNFNKFTTNNKDVLKTIVANTLQEFAAVYSNDTTLFIQNREEIRKVLMNKNKEDRLLKVLDLYQKKKDENRTALLSVRDNIKLVLVHNINNNFGLKKLLRDIIQLPGHKDDSDEDALLAVINISDATTDSEKKRIIKDIDTEHDLSGLKQLIPDWKKVLADHPVYQMEQILELFITDEYNNALLLVNPDIREYTNDTPIFQELLRMFRSLKGHSSDDQFTALLAIIKMDDLTDNLAEKEIIKFILYKYHLGKFKNKRNEWKMKLANNHTATEGSSAYSALVSCVLKDFYATDRVYMDYEFAAFVPKAFENTFKNGVVVEFDDNLELGDHRESKEYDVNDSGLAHHIQMKLNHLSYMTVVKGLGATNQTTNPIGDSHGKIKMPKLKRTLYPLLFEFLSNDPKESLISSHGGNSSLFVFLWLSQQKKLRIRSKIDIDLLSKLYTRLRLQKLNDKVVEVKDAFDSFFTDVTFFLDRKIKSYKDTKISIQDFNMKLFNELLNHYVGSSLSKLIEINIDIKQYYDFEYEIEEHFFNFIQEHPVVNKHKYRILINTELTVKDGSDLALIVKYENLLKNAKITMMPFTDLLLLTQTERIDLSQFNNIVFNTYDFDIAFDVKSINSIENFSKDCVSKLKLNEKMLQALFCQISKRFLKVALRGRSEVNIEMILNNGSVFSSADKDNIFEYAVDLKSSISLITKLINKNVFNKENSKPILTAISTKRKPLINLLLSSSASIPNRGVINELLSLSPNINELERLAKACNSFEPIDSFRRLHRRHPASVALYYDNKDAYDYFINHESINYKEVLIDIINLDLGDKDLTPFKKAVDDLSMKIGPNSKASNDFEDLFESELLPYLLDINVINPNHICRYGKPILQLVSGSVYSQVESYNLVKILVGKGVDVNQQDRSGNTFLMNWVEDYEKLQLDTIKLVLPTANLNLHNKKDETVFNIIARRIKKYENTIDTAKMKYQRANSESGKKGWEELQTKAKVSIANYTELLNLLNLSK
jgi:hypothetical protein